MVLAHTTSRNCSCHDEHSPYQAQNIVAKPLSIDQKPEFEEERKRIEQAGGTVTFGRVDGDLSVSRALGDFDLKMSNETFTSHYMEFIRRIRQSQNDPHDDDDSDDKELDNGKIRLSSLQMSKR